MVLPQNIFTNYMTIIMICNLKTVDEMIKYLYDYKHIMGHVINGGKITVVFSTK